MSYDEIKEIIKNNNIKSRTELLLLSRTFYKHFLKLKEEEKDQLLPPLNRLSYLPGLVTINDFKIFIETNNIRSRSQLEDEFPSVYIKFKELFTAEEKELLLPSKNKPCNVTTEESFIKLIEGNNITTRDNFRIKFPTAYNKFLKLDKNVRDRILPKIGVKYTNINTKDDVLEFISTNKITSRSELYKKYSTVYDKFLLLFTKKEQAEIFPLISYDDLNTVNDFSKFIQENKIISRGDFSKRFKSAYSKFMNVLKKEDRDNILPSLVQNDYTGLVTKEDFREFLLKNKIKTRKELDNKAPKGYVRFRTLLSTEDQNDLLPPVYRNFSSLTDFYSIKQFIEEHEVLSRKDLDVRFGGAYRKFLEVLSDEEKDVLLPTIKSLGEIQLQKLLEDNSISYETEKTFSDLRGEGDASLRYDFYLPNYNALLEYHGSQHFNPNTDFYTERGIELDRIKYNYAKNKRIPILYFTNEIYFYKKFGYFTEVITDEDILLKKIKEIGLTTQFSS